MVELLTLEEELKNGTYNPGEYYSFSHTCPGTGKTRLIRALKFRDSIIQHAIYIDIYETLDKTFIHDNYGCRKGKGTLRANTRCQEFMRRCDGELYYLQMDIRRYYHRIKHSILESLLLKKLPKRIVNLCMLFVDTSREIGLNVGNLLSQIFGILYLNTFDHFVKRILKSEHYIRYVDDSVIIGLTREQAYRFKDLCERFLLDTLELVFSKWKIQRIKRGINFVGYRTWKSRRFIRKRSLVSFSRALRNRDVKAVQSILAHARNSSSFYYLWNLTKEYHSSLVIPYPSKI